MDSAFLQRLQAGDEKAFGELLTRWQRPILSFLYRLTGDAAAADDLAQEVFIRVWRSIGTFRQDTGGAGFAAWLFQIARNAALDHLRHRRRHPAESIETVGDSAHRVPGTVSAGDAAAEHREIGEAIAAAVLRLPEDQRTAIALAEYEGLSVVEIAAIMKCTEKSVEARLYRARQTLRQQLAYLL